MANESTAAIASDWSVAALPTLRRSESTESRAETPVLVIASRAARRMGPGDKEAILESLYAERRILTRAARDHALADLDQQNLDDINLYVDDLETEQEPSRDGADDVWRKLDKLTESMLAFRGNR